MTTVTVRASSSYDVCIGRGLLRQAGAMLRQLVPTDRAMVVADQTVHDLHGHTLAASLEKAGVRVERFVFPPGEASKSPGTYMSLLNALAEARFTRGEPILALGGGVTGDLAGFAAATYLRGVPFVQLPTTLLAAVDSSVGGKTAIDLPAGKNLCGAFYQPKLVLCDLDALETLPEDVFRAGCAEVVKYGVIADRELFESLKTGFRADPGAVIARCIRIKRDVVAEDEFDTGRRAILNFGHTIGHAAEVCSGYALSHGQAVAVGMAAVTRAAVRRGLCDNQTLTDLLEMLRRYGLPERTELPKKDLLEAMLSDKKRSGGTVKLILPRRIGEVSVQTLPVDTLADFLDDALEGEP